MVHWAVFSADYAACTVTAHPAQEAPKGGTVLYQRSQSCGMRPPRAFLPEHLFRKLYNFPWNSFKTGLFSLQFNSLEGEK
jgi:hypothetical protein